MSPYVFVSFSQKTPYGPEVSSCVVEMPSPISDPNHMAELRVLVAEKAPGWADASVITLLSWRRLEQEGGSD